jgi:hypothetical protein
MAIITCEPWGSSNQHHEKKEFGVGLNTTSIAKQNPKQLKIPIIQISK